MKRILLLISFCISFAFHANSQVLIVLLFGDALNTDKISFGLAAGANISKLTNLESAAYIGNLDLGFFFDFKIGEHWYIHPEVLVKNTVGAKNLSPYPSSDPALDPFLENGSVVRQINIISVPILAKYRTDNGWGVEAGPQFGLRTRAYDIFRTTISDQEELELRVDIGDQLKRINAGGAVGISKKLGRRSASVTLVARYYFGFIDLYKDNPGDPVKTQGFIINANIPIGVGAKKASEESNVEE